MISYVIKRLLYFIPTLIAISLVIFFLSKSTPGDPLDHYIELQENISRGDISTLEAAYCQQYRKFKLDKPLFYFSVSSSVLDSRLREVCNYNVRQWQKKLNLQFGNYDKVQSYSEGIWSVQDQIMKLSDTIAEKNALKTSVNRLLYNLDFDKIKSELKQLSGLVSGLPDIELQRKVEQLVDYFDSMTEERAGLGVWLPKIQWHGISNQYHIWFSKLLKLDFGTSRVDGRPVFDKLASALNWTLLLVFMSYFLTLLIGIPLGVFLGARKDSRLDKWISSLMYLLYAIPIFWLATLLVVFFTTDEYGQWTNIFPSIFPLQYSSEDSFWFRLGQSAEYLILPVICIAIHSLAYISRLTRASIIDQMDQPYVLTAKAKGLNKKQVLWKHIFPNAMIPILSLLIASIPAAFAGSVVIEVIFNIPGMGRLIFDSTFNTDWPVVFGAVMLIGFLTMIIYLAGDILYRYVNPKISFDR